jgi:phenylalanyl-tRNA synthetase beta chain
MKYLYSWLKEYYDFNQTPEELAEIIVALGTEIESIKANPEIDSRVIVAKILEVKDHPNADRLHIAKITTGKDELEVVCGAANIEEGQLVPFAQTGAKFGDFEIKEAEIRGVKSPGMLCSEKELGLGDSHEGIKILENVEIGERVSKYLTKDAVLEAEVTPNRGDVLSHIGLARDLAAYFKTKPSCPKIEIIESAQKAQDELSVEIRSDKCSLYLARVIKGVKIGPSPNWLKEKLLAIGAKPINNVVDVTNYVMFDLGQPLHAFDAKKIKDKKIVVREIDQEIDIETLDGTKRALLPGMLAICDSRDPIAISGVMGLGNSEIDEKTSDIVLEAAVFDRKSVRKTAKLLSLVSEASYRFERGIDAKLTELALTKAAKMIQELAGGEILSSVVKAGEVPESNFVKLDYQLINNLSGAQFEKETVDQILSNLGFRIEGETVLVPSWRHDIHDKEDLVEEIIRISGLNIIKPEALKTERTPAPSEYFKKEKIKDFLVKNGLTEALNYAFLSDADVVAVKLDSKDLVEVANPVQEENKYLRNSLVPLMLKNVAKNPSFDDIEIFEVGNIFLKDSEQTYLAIATSGRSARKAGEIVKKLCQTFSISETAFNIFDIDREELKRFKIKKPNVSVAEVSLGEILPKIRFDNLTLASDEAVEKYKAISKYPPVKRDLSFVVDGSINLQEIKKAILSSCDNVFLVEAFDEFVDKRFGEGKKNIAFHIWLQDLDKTLSDTEAKEAISKIISDLKVKFGAELRS